ncbi:MAG: Arylsulfatase [bacterium ADurb.Bin429]|nr:MAG: Arylsulfatase [bacterium ADurb.Bin429]
MTQPNIIFILMDDMGWRDLSCTGSTFYETPHIDRLATEGMRFTDAYAACPVCSPSRASILTGKYPATVGITDWIDWGGWIHPARGRVVDVPYLKELPASETTLAAALREGGYQTWHVGKWHLGGPGHYPDQHGFDVNVGGCEWGCPTKGYFSPWQIPVLPDAPEGTYLTDHITDAAIDLIRASDGRPFFLNWWHYAVHTPIQAPAELVAKYEEKAKALGLDKIQAIEEGEHFPCEHKRNQHVQRRRIQSDPVYAAMIENLDWNIGRLLEALAEAGQAENTLVIFTAEGKGWMYEGGTREPLLIRWPGVISPGSVCPSPLTSPDFYPTLLDAANLPHRPEQHVDGVSFLPLLRGEAMERGPIFWHYPHYGNQGGTPGCSVRDGDWKLIEFFEDGRLELYHLREDAGETHNRAAEEPDITRRLHAELVAWRESVEAKIPARNEAWEEAPV